MAPEPVLLNWTVVSYKVKVPASQSLAARATCTYTQDLWAVQFTQTVLWDDTSLYVNSLSDDSLHRQICGTKFYGAAVYTNSFRLHRRFG